MWDGGFCLRDGRLVWLGGVDNGKEKVVGCRL
jgi:hypothetical protein